MSGSEQSNQEGVDFESAISSGSVSEGSSNGSLMPMAYYNFEPSVTDSGSSSETSSDEYEDKTFQYFMVRCYQL